MYFIGMKKDFVARHYLTGGDWGPENVEHSHYYHVEMELRGEGLDEHGYLVDFVDVENHLEMAVAHYRDALLNDLAEFSGLNPSVERLARIFCEGLSPYLSPVYVKGIRVTVWEKQGVWAAYEEERG